MSEKTNPLRQKSSRTNPGKVKNARPRGARLKARPGRETPETDPSAEPQAPASVENPSGLQPALSPAQTSGQAPNQATGPDAEQPSALVMSEALTKARAIEWQMRDRASQDQTARQWDELNGVLETILGHLGTQATQLQAQESRLSNLHRQLSDLEGSTDTNRTSR